MIVPLFVENSFHNGNQGKFKAGNFQYLSKCEILMSDVVNEKKNRHS